MVIIMAIILAIAIPNINAALKSQRNKETAQSIVTALKSARAEGQLRHRDMMVSWDVSSIKVEHTTGGVTEQLSSYSFHPKAPMTASSSSITFKPNKTVNLGSPTAQTFVFTTYCNSDKSEEGRKVTIDNNGNIAINTGASKC